VTTMEVNILFYLLHTS